VGVGVSQLTKLALAAATCDARRAALQPAKIMASAWKMDVLEIEIPVESCCGNSECHILKIDADAVGEKVHCGTYLLPSPGDPLRESILIRMLLQRVSCSTHERMQPRFKVVLD